MIKVLKFGGSSVATPSKIKDIANYLKTRVSNGEKLVVVVSAMGKETNELVALAKDVVDTPSGREFDQLLAIGEIKTTALMAMCLNSLELTAKSFTASQLGIHTVGEFQSSKIENISKENIEQALETNDVLVVAGFQGVNKHNDMTTLGRGGSDTSAVAIAAVLGVDCEIYTDVDGVYTTDPRICPNARKIDYISYEEMNELSSLGAKVMHNRSITVASKYDVNVYVGKTLSKEKGTWIMNRNKLPMVESNIVTAVAVEEDVLSTSFKITTSPELEKYIIDIASNHKVNIDMVSKVYFAEETNLAFTCSNAEENKLNAALNEINNNEKAKAHILKCNTKIYNKLSLVGLGMKDATGVVGRLFDTLSESNIKFYQVTTSEISISLLIDKENTKEAVYVVMKEFGVVDDCSLEELR